MRISIQQLRDLADELSKEGKELEEKLGINDKELIKRKWSIPIINKTSASDAWEIEK